MTRDREAQSQTSLPLRPDLIALAEPIEDIGHHREADAAAVVADLDRGIPMFASHSNGNPATRSISTEE